MFTLFDEDIIGGGHSIGSAHGKLVDLLSNILVTNKDTSTNTNNNDILMTLKMLSWMQLTILLGIKFNKSIYKNDK